MESKPKSRWKAGFLIYKKYMPKDVYDTIIEHQENMKDKCGCGFNRVQTLYKIILNSRGKSLD